MFKSIFQKERKTDLTELCFTLLIFLVALFLLIAPARFYDKYSLIPVESKIAIGYLSVIDFVCLGEILLLVIYFLIYKDRKALCLTVNKEIIPFAFIYLVCSIGLVATSHYEYVFEVVSKFLTLTCGLTLSAFVLNYKKEKFFEAFVIIFLLIICVAPIFLKNYKGYGDLHLGFFVNETGYFCCALTAIALFAMRKKILLRLILLAFSLYGSYICGSRRSILIAIMLVFVFVIYSYARLIVKNKSDKKTVLMLSIIGLAVAVIVALLISYNAQDIINKTVSLKRFIEEFEKSGSFLGADRVKVYETALTRILGNLWLGNFGSTTLGSMTNFSDINHTHNLILQFFGDYGLIFGAFFTLLFIIAFCCSLGNIFTKGSTTSKLVAYIFAMYFFYDMLGYGLWNPKMQILIYMCGAINIYYFYANNKIHNTIKEGDYQYVKINQKILIN